MLGPIRRLWRNRWWLLREPIWFIQRGARGWADCDWWNIDDYLAKVIVGMLTKMRNEGCSTPCMDPGTGDPVTEEEWRDILDQMIAGFAVIKADDPGWGDDFRVRVALSLFVKWFPSLWD